MTALFPNYNTTHSGKTANSQLLNGSQSGKALSRTMDVIAAIMAMF